jgi:hypothetical protein
MKQLKLCKQHYQKQHWKHPKTLSNNHHHRKGHTIFRMSVSGVVGGSTPSLLVDSFVTGPWGCFDEEERQVAFYICNNRSVQSVKLNNPLVAPSASYASENLEA